MNENGETFCANYLSVQKNFQSILGKYVLMKIFHFFKEFVQIGLINQNFIVPARLMNEPKTAWIIIYAQFSKKKSQKISHKFFEFNLRKKQFLFIIKSEFIINLDNEYLLSLCKNLFAVFIYMVNCLWYHVARKPKMFI